MSRAQAHLLHLLLDAQREHVSGVIRAAVEGSVDIPSKWVEVGRFCGVEMSTVNSLVAAGLIEVKPNDVGNLVAAIYYPSPPSR